ncbi:MAG: hypothetical protein OXU20_05330 [Myxococcales bacterium]|nr:hypothetical protein [Myxococcales bacterium]
MRWDGEAFTLVIGGPSATEAWHVTSDGVLYLLETLDNSQSSVLWRLEGDDFARVPDVPEGQWTSVTGGMLGDLWLYGTSDDDPAVARFDGRSWRVSAPIAPRSVAGWTVVTGGQLLVSDRSSLWQFTCPP